MIPFPVSKTRTWDWEGGHLTVEADGSLSFAVGDDYYDGTISRDDAMVIARAIMQAAGSALLPLKE